MNQVILSLDTQSQDKANHLVLQLRDHLSHIKIGHIALSSLKREFLQDLLKGFPIILDLKFFDIPNTVATAISNYKNIFPSIAGFTFYGGMDDVTINKLLTLDIGVYPIAVLVLSSQAFSQEEFMSLAQKNVDLGVRHFICPPYYVQSMRKKFNRQVQLFSPGIRNSNDSFDDHQIISGQSDSFSDLDTDYCIIGRPLLLSDDPQKKIQEYL